MDTRVDDRGQTPKESAYWNELIDLLFIVRKNLIASECKPVFEMHEAVLRWVGPKRNHLISVFAREAERLLEEAEKGRAQAHLASNVEVTEPQDRLMEKLTATWLGMYFLACPAMHPWEAVAFFAEGSGFPLGASLCKAMGDVYRNARKSILSGQGNMHSADMQPLYVLDHNPLALKRVMDGIDSQRGQPCTDESKFLEHVFFLGMMYERLQLALYLNSGGAIRFYVPEESLRQALAPAHGKPPGDDVQEKVRFMWEQVSHCFPDEFANDQMIIVHDVSLRDMPGCVLAPNAGMFRTRGISEAAYAIQHTGNYLPSSLREEFKKRLQAIVVPVQAAPLQTLDLEMFRARLPITEAGAPAMNQGTA